MPAAPETIVPTVALPPAIPLTLQATPVTELPEPETDAVKTCAPPVGTVAVSGEIFTVMLSVSVTFAEPETVASAALIAVMVTPGVDGRIAGAVYSPAVEIVPSVALPLTAPFTSQVTAVLEVPASVAWNCCVAPSERFALPG